MEISILVLTYNHEKFVKQALDSIIMQEINVPYEIIILDDASTDGTVEILKKYKKNYPEIISLYLRKTNSGYPTRNGYFLLSKAQGRYFAFLDGDDYWIHNLKIQRQFDFLESNKEYSACVTDLIVVDEDNNVTGKRNYLKKDHIFTLEDFRRLRQPGMTVSFLGRNYFNKKEYSIIYKADKMMGDITVYMLSLIKGNIYQMDEVMAAYRNVRRKGESNFNSIQQGNIYRNYMQTRYWVQLENFMQQYHKGFQFAPMVSIIKQTVMEYPLLPGIALFRESEFWKKYLFYYLVFAIHKRLLDSDYILDIKTDSFYSWDSFKREKKPIILFGTGAVAEEYIDKYAWKRNISFLVDNDEKKQNTSMKGFLIKNPKEILKYKNKMRVLITSKNYEKEIGQQLQEMEIDAYYCYCSMQTHRLRNIIAKKLLKLVPDIS